MPRLKTYVLDDDPVMRLLLSGFVGRHPQLVLSGVGSTAAEAIEHLRREPADLLLLDIGLPDLNGFSVLAELSPVPSVIVVTGDGAHAIDAFEHAALDFLLKPFTFDRFCRAALRAVDLHPCRTARKEGPADLEANASSKITLSVGRQRVLLPIDEIEMVQSVGNHCRVRRSSGNLLAHISLSRMEQLLPSDRFIRVHRSYIVAFNSIHSFSKSKVALNGISIPVGARYRDSFLRSMQAMDLGERSGWHDQTS
jgi:DNA-binding LytR/AlgR family response regulator